MSAWRLAPGTLSTVGDSPPSSRPLHPFQVDGLHVYIRTRLTTSTNGTPDPGTGVWSDWAQVGNGDFSVFAVACNSLHEASLTINLDGSITATEPTLPHVVASSYDIEVAGRVLPVQITVRDTTIDETGTTPETHTTYHTRDAVVLVPGSMASATFDYPDPGLAKSTYTSGCMICIPAMPR